MDTCETQCHQQIAGQVFQCVCAKSQCIMAQSVEVDIGQISGSFNLQSVFSYNIVNVGRLIINNWENTLNFCCEVGVLRSERNCKGCRRVLKLRRESRPDHLKLTRASSEKGNTIKGDTSRASGLLEASVARLEIFFWRLVLITNETRRRSSTLSRGT